MKWSHLGGFAVLLLSVTLTSAKSLENVTDPITSTVQTLPIEGITQDSDSKNVSKEPTPVSEDKDDKSRRLNLDYGQMRQTVDGNIPEPIVISSQPITVNRRESTGSMGNKRGRSLSADGITEIEGVRVPDNEEDKFHTWRNGRVIKNMLVPNGRSAQPHRKRQIVVQDATQYLASHGLTVPQFQQLYHQQQQQQQTGGMDAAALAQVGQIAAASQQQNVFYAQPQPQQAAQHQQFYAQDLNTGAIYATAAPLSAQHHFTASPMPIQTVTATPVVFQSDGQMYTAGNRFPVNSQFHARTGVEIQSQAPSVENGQLQPVAKPQVSIYSPSSPKQPETPVTRVEFQPMPDAESEKSQTQQAQNSGQAQGDQKQAATSSIVLQQGASTLIQTQQQPGQQQQQHQHPLAQVIQIQQPQQELEAQASQQVAQIIQAHQHQHEHQQQHQQQQQQQLTAQVLQVQQQQHQLHQLQPIDPQHQHVTQIIQLQPQQQQQQHDQVHAATMIQQIPGQPTAYILQPSPSMAPDMIEDRNSPVYTHTANNNRYVIKPQTYVAGPGGQVFTVPVPIPADEEEEEHQHQQQIHRRREGDEAPPKKERGTLLMHKVMDSLTMSKKTIERVETNVALPVLATAGVLFGLGALAAAWYLSSQNREVGFLRRTGKPLASTVGGVNLKRTRRQASEVDQAGFFQSIIQHAIEKQQKEFEETIEPAESSPVALTIPTMPKYRPNKLSSPVHSRLDETEFSDKGSYGHTTHVTHSNPTKWKKTKSHWIGSKQALNFAKVAIPAVVLGGAVLAIGALIFGWYISGSNREIAFLEPSAYSRKKRDLTTMNLSDSSWVQRLLSSIHNNPYAANGGGGESSQSTLMSFFDFDTSKGNSFDFKSDLSHAVVAVSLASVAFLTMLALVLAWLFSENERAVNWLETGGVGFGGWPNHYRRARSLSTNSIESGGDPGSTLNPGFLASILTDLDVSHSRIIKKLQETGYSDWQETPCAKRIFCDVMSTQSDDTIRAMEKRMVTFVSMLPNSLSSSLSRTLGAVMNSIHRRDCSPFTCKGHWVDPSFTDQPSNPVNHPR